eukprot:680779-Hanusia_phi.AAC.1
MEDPISGHNHREDTALSGGHVDSARRRLAGLDSGPTRIISRPAGTGVLDPGLRGSNRDRHGPGRGLAALKT